MSSTFEIVRKALLPGGLSKLAEEVAELERERDMYRELHRHSLNCVDRVFQADSTKSAPLLPDFLQYGDDKFEGVIKLAEAYLADKSRLDWLESQQHNWLGVYGEFEMKCLVCAGAAYVQNVRKSIDHAIISERGKISGQS